MPCPLVSWLKGATACGSRAGPTVVLGPVAADCASGRHGGSLGWAKSGTGREQTADRGRNRGVSDAGRGGGAGAAGGARRTALLHVRHRGPDLSGIRRRWRRKRGVQCGLQCADLGPRAGTGPAGTEPARPETHYKSFTYSLFCTSLAKATISRTVTRMGRACPHCPGVLLSHTSQSASRRLVSVWSGPVAQRLELAAHNGLVAGSNPAGPTKTHRQNGHAAAGRTEIRSGLMSLTGRGEFRGASGCGAPLRMEPRPG